MDNEAKSDLLEALAFYRITVVTDTGKEISVQNGYTIEVEANGLYKLREGDIVIAPFDDLNELCRFILV